MFDLDYSYWLLGIYFIYDFIFLNQIFTYKEREDEIIIKYKLKYIVQNEVCKFLVFLLLILFLGYLTIKYSYFFIVIILIAYYFLFKYLKSIDFKKRIEFIKIDLKEKTIECKGKKYNIYEIEAFSIERQETGTDRNVEYVFKILKKEKEVYVETFGKYKNILFVIVIIQKFLKIPIKFYDCININSKREISENEMF